MLFQCLRGFSVNTYWDFLDITVFIILLQRQQTDHEFVQEPY